MFTGLVEEKGQVVEISPTEDGLRLEIFTGTLFEDGLPDTGDSIAVEGVCLTATEVFSDRFLTDVSSETVRCTTFGQLETQDAVNLETSLEVGQEIGGHFVFGHVDDTAEITQFQSIGDGYDLTVEFSSKYAPYIARKGSVALDGISLTVNEVDARKLTVRIIPHTYKNTTLGEKSVGDMMNLEVDMLARYVERMITTRDDLPNVS